MLSLCVQSLENRVISMESSSSPWYSDSSRRTLSYEEMVSCSIETASNALHALLQMLPEDSPDYELIPKPIVRSFTLRRKKISVFNAVCVQCCERFRAQDNSRKE